MDLNYFYEVGIVFNLIKWALYSLAFYYYFGNKTPGFLWLSKLVTRYPSIPASWTSRELYVNVPVPCLLPSSLLIWKMEPWRPLPSIESRTSYDVPAEVKLPRLPWRQVVLAPILPPWISALVQPARTRDWTTRNLPSRATRLAGWQDPPNPSPLQTIKLKWQNYWNVESLFDFFISSGLTVLVCMSELESCFMRRFFFLCNGFDSMIISSSSSEGSQFKCPFCNQTTMKSNQRLNR